MYETALKYLEIFIYVYMYVYICMLARVFVSVFSCACAYARPCKQAFNNRETYYIGY